MKPKPAKPRIIIAHVEASGTAPVTTGLMSSETPPRLSGRKPSMIKNARFVVYVSVNSS